MHRGYIKIWRKIRDSFIWDDPEGLKIWIHLILKANHKNKETLFNGKKLLVKRGSLICGRHQLESELGINQHKIYRFLNVLENEHLIKQQKTNVFTLVSIVCYNDYQSNEQQGEQPMSNECTTSEQRVSTSKELISIKNELKNVYSPNFLEVWNKYPNRIGKKESERHFIASVKTKEDFDNINKALDQYLQHLENNQWKKTQNASTWFNNWRDYIDYEEPNGDSKELRELKQLRGAGKCDQ